MTIGSFVRRYRDCATAQPEVFPGEVLRELDALCARLDVDLDEGPEQLSIVDPRSLAAELPERFAALGDLLDEAGRTGEQVLVREFVLGLRERTGGEDSIGQARELYAGSLRAHAEFLLEQGEYQAAADAAECAVGQYNDPGDAAYAMNILSTVRYT